MHDLQPPVAINESEAIVDPFWDERITTLPQYVLTPCPAGGGTGEWVQARSRQFWSWANVLWEHAPIDAPVLTFAREMGVDIEGYDRLVVAIAAPRHIRLTVRATIDGQERTVIENDAGRSAVHEFEGAIDGRRLERLAITFSTDRDHPEAIWLYWTGLANAGRREAMLSRAGSFARATWQNWLLPEAKPPFAPRFGFFFSAEDLPAIRRRANSPAYRPLMERLRAQAREAMAFHRTPEEQIGPYLHSGQVWQLLARERDVDTRPFYLEVPIIAFVGLVDEDAELLRFAARIALSVAHTEHWAADFMQSFPGSTWDTRAFPEARATAGLALALDWAGACFNERGEHLIRYAIAEKGLPKVRHIFLQYDYMWDNNQTHLICLGRLLGLLLEQRAWPRAAADIDIVERDLQEMIDRYIQEDGSSNEGVGYWAHTFRATMPALYALARYRRRPLAEVLPAKLHRMWNFIAPLLSTADEPGSFLPISDTVGNKLFWDTIGPLAAAPIDGGWKGLLGACLNGGKTYRPKMDVTFDGPFTIIFGPDEAPAPRIDVPVFRLLDKAGMATSNRPWGAGNVRLHLVGHMANAGHSHADKGSFILEACGDLFAADRGMTPNEDADTWWVLKSEYSHNMAVPEGVRQMNPAPADALWQAEGDKRTLTACIDTSAVWPAPVRRATRTIYSPEPGLIEITDEFALDEARAISFYLNTPLPIAVKDSSATVTGRSATLHVSADWAASMTAGPYYCDWEYKPYQRLVVTSTPAKEHVLRTVLRFAKA